MEIKTCPPTKVLTAPWCPELHPDGISIIHYIARNIPFQQQPPPCTQPIWRYNVFCVGSMLYYRYQITRGANRSDDDVDPLPPNSPFTTVPMHFILAAACAYVAIKLHGDNLTSESVIEGVLHDIARYVVENSHKLRHGCGGEEEGTCEGVVGGSGSVYVVSAFVEEMLGLEMDMLYSLGFVTNVPCPALITRNDVVDHHLWDVLKGVYSDPSVVECDESELVKRITGRVTM
eukprot:PhF_6_TR23823/c0_g1_i1/m.33385